MSGIVVTGATSMIGVALIKAAISDLDINRIYAVIRPGTEKISRLPQNEKILIIECGMDHYNRLPDLVPDSVSIFFHLAWPRTPTYAESFDDTYEKVWNILYVMDALKSAQKLGCRAFVGAGSQSEYGIVETGQISTETLCNPVRADGVIHLAAGRLVELTVKEMGMDSAWLRIFSIYGTNDRDNSLVKSTIRKLKEGGRCSFTKSEQMWDYLFEDDAGKAFLEAGKKVRGNKTYNLGYGEAKPLREYISAIRDIVAPEAKLHFGELPYPKDPVMNLQCDTASLRKDTGWRPMIPFEDGIRRMMN